MMTHQVFNWTTPQAVLERLRKRWNTGAYLTQLADGAPWEPVEIPLRGPKAGDITRHYDQVLAWTESWAPSAHRHLRIEYRRLGGRLAGDRR